MFPPKRDFTSPPIPMPRASYLATCLSLIFWLNDMPPVSCIATPPVSLNLRHVPCLLYSDTSRVSYLATRPVSPVSPARVKQSNGERSARARVLLSSQSPLIVQVQHYEHRTRWCKYFSSDQQTTRHHFITWHRYMVSDYYHYHQWRKANEKIGRSLLWSHWL